MEDRDWMAMALEEARLASSEGEVPVGAVIAGPDGTLLARAHNLRERNGDPTAHAELLCMREAAKKLGAWRLTGCTLYVTLEPCPMCAGAMVVSHLPKCVYGAEDAGLGCCGSVYDLPADPALNGGSGTWRAGVMKEECSALLTGFFRGRRKDEAHENHQTR